MTNEEKSRVKKYKLFEVVSDVEHLDFKKTKEEVLDVHDGIRNYAAILHDKDEDDKGNLKNPHYHIFIRTFKSNSFKTVAGWFGLSENFVGRVKGNWTDALQYLTHQNAEKKHQYDESEVISNYDWKAEKESAERKKQSRRRKEDIIEMIVSGEIRQYNYFDYITPLENDAFKQSIDKAFKYRLDTIKGGDREMECIMIHGKPGTGKTTYAKALCRQKGYSYFVSSGSNDVLDGYGGQDAIILDDLRPSCMGLSDLLKMLDNHTASSVKSRYQNKVLECKLIVITSVLPIDEFFKNVFSEQKEPILQLKRRCGFYYEFYEQFYTIQIFDESTGDYGKKYKYSNPIYNKFPKVKLTEQEVLNRIGDMTVTGSEYMGKDDGFMTVDDEELPFD
ncbi:MAG: AAA family ATPase [Lachnospiraceae bacterium]|nr:AAA family ATPase [Lachnospiraceae bacterium]